MSIRLWGLMRPAASLMLETYLNVPQVSTADARCTAKPGPSVGFTVAHQRSQHGRIARALQSLQLKEGLTPAAQNDDSDFPWRSEPTFFN